MNFLRRFLLRLISPAMARERNATINHLDWLRRQIQTRVTRDQVNNAHQEAQWHEAHLEFIKICDQRDLILQTLMNLVAKDELGTWTTVFDADTALPQEVSDHLDGLVQAV